MPEDSNHKSQQVTACYAKWVQTICTADSRKLSYKSVKKPLEKETAQTREFMLSLIFPSS